jgi:hypothetical protein
VLGPGGLVGSIFYYNFFFQGDISSEPAEVASSFAGMYNIFATLEKGAKKKKKNNTKFDGPAGLCGRRNWIEGGGCGF